MSTAALRVALAGVPFTFHGIPGRPDRSLVPVGAAVHHDVSSKDNAAALRIVIEGRGQPNPVPGPLYNIYVRRDGSVHIISEGSANHGGRHRSETLPRMLRGEPPVRPVLDDDRRTTELSDRTVGVCFANNGTTEPYPAVQIAAGVAVLAALCRHFGWSPASRVLGHREGTRRKIDPSFPVDEIRRLVAAALAATPEPAPEPEPNPWKEPEMIVIKHGTKRYNLGGTRKRELSGAQATELAAVLGQTVVPEVSGDLLGRFLPDAPTPTLAQVQAAVAAAVAGVSPTVDLTAVINDALADAFAAAADALDG